MHDGKSHGMRMYAYTTSKKHCQRERRKKWFMVFFEDEPSNIELEARSRPMARGLGLGWPSSPRPKSELRLKLKLISYDD